ncbi:MULTISPECIES: hypothetical protein [unclassified Paenibacillus]|uniref:hypothetical protein n=1 Tax=unclassified Paenibacillus TaxID=185978 RepID=UPI0030F513C0
MKYAKLEEMKKLAAGHPHKIAAYSAAKREYNDTIATMFTEDAPFKYVGSPTESYVQEAEAHASKTGDADDLARAAILRDRFDYYDGLSDAGFELRTAATSLRAKLESGDPLSAKDVRDAHRLAKLTSSADNIALYSRIKHGHENPSERPARTEPEDSKVTAEDVEAARTAAQANPSAQNIARFSIAKREYAAQTEASE